MWLLAVILLTSYAYSLDLNQDVDYWGIEPKKQIEIPKNKKEKEPSGEDLVKQSINWYIKKIKKEKSPVEYYYFLNPKKYAKAKREFDKWKQVKGNELVKYQILQARPEKFNIDKIYNQLKKKGYEILYFYSKSCPYCQFSEPEIKAIASNLKVYFIEKTKEPDMFQKWNVRATPTVIFVSAKEKKAYRYKGAFTRVELLNYIYRLIKNENNNTADSIDNK